MFPVWVIVNKASVTILVPLSCCTCWERNGWALGNVHASLYQARPSMKGPMAPHPCMQLVLFNFKKILPAEGVWNGISTGFKWSFFWLLIRLNIFFCLWDICALSSLKFVLSFFLFSSPYPSLPSALSSTFPFSPLPLFFYWIYSLMFLMYY